MKRFSPVIGLCVVALLAIQAWSESLLGSHVPDSLAANLRGGMCNGQIQAFCAGVIGKTCVTGMKWIKPAPGASPTNFWTVLTNAPVGMFCTTNMCMKSYTHAKCGGGCIIR